MRRHADGRTKVKLALVVALLSCGLTVLVLAMAGGKQTGRTVDYGHVADAVRTAVPGVTNVRDLARSTNGFGRRLSLGLETDSADPFTAEELDAVVGAIWRSLPWEPNAIEITAGADTDRGHEVVDLRAAAAELSPLSVTNAGSRGVGLTGMAQRYGAWKGP